MLVCLAVWMCYGARTNIDRVVTVVPPISIFVAAGFEHCIANIYFIPAGLLIKAGAPESFWKAIGKSPADFQSLTWENFISEPCPGDARQYRRRVGVGGGGLLVRLSAQEGAGLNVSQGERHMHDSRIFVLWSSGACFFP